MRWPWQKEYPPWIEAYRSRTDPKPERRRAVSECAFVVIDAETTGFNLVKDRMVSLAALPVAGARMHIADLRSWVIFQPNAKASAAVQIHGILPRETASGEPEEHVMRELLPLLAGAVVVGHHIGFDLAMLGAALKRAGGPPLRHPFVDTAKLAQASIDAFARTGYPGQKDPSLDEVCTHLGIETMERHTADGDVFTTATLFLTLLSHLKRRRGRELTLGDLPLGTS